MPQCKDSFPMAHCDGHIYTIGGYVRQEKRRLSETTCYSIAKNEWREMASYPFEIYGSALCALGGWLYNLGGLESGWGVGRIDISKPGAKWNEISVKDGLSFKGWCYRRCEVLDDKIVYFGRDREKKTYELKVEEGSLVVDAELDCFDFLSHYDSSCRVAGGKILVFGHNNYNQVWSYGANKEWGIELKK